MLVLKRKTGEKVIIDCEGTRIEVMVTDVHAGAVRLGFTAPDHVSINRDEIQREIDNTGRSYRPQPPIRREK